MASVKSNSQNHICNSLQIAAGESVKTEISSTVTVMKGSKAGVLAHRLSCQRWCVCPMSVNNTIQYKKMAWQIIFLNTQIYDSHPLDVMRVVSIWLCHVNPLKIPLLPVSGIPCARCIREFSTSFADTKKIRLGAWARSTTFSSSTRKFTHLSVCCLRTWDR